MGMYIGFTGNVTFKNAKKVLLAASAADIDLLLVETDCPYMAPEPFRGRRCDSSMIDISAAVLAGDGAKIDAFKKDIREKQFQTKATS